MYKPNFHGMILQNGEIGLNMIALPFIPAVNPAKWKIEEVWPEYTDGGYFKADGTISSNVSYAYAVVDVSKYKYVYLPCVTCHSVSIYSGCRSNEGSGNIIKFIDYKTGSSDAVFASYAIFEPKTYKYACVSVGANMKLPIIGIIED